MPRSFSHLSYSDISELKLAFQNAQLWYDADLRKLLMNGISFQYVASLGMQNSDNRQLTADLNSLNTLERLDDGSVPLREWLRNAYEQFASRTEQKVFAQALETLDRQQSAEPRPPSDTDTIVDGFEALSALVRKCQPAYEAFVIYGNAFHTALDDIDVIADYKLLHEETHGLQLAWPDDISLLLQNLAEDPKAQMNLRKDSNNLKNIISRQRAIFSKGCVDRSESEWIDNLDSLLKELDAALNEVAKVKIETTFDAIRSQVSVQLFKLNDRLKRAIERLHLKDLIAAMKTLCGGLKNISSGRLSNHIERYQAGLVELEAKDAEIAKLILQHDDWQVAMSRLQLVGEQLEGASREEDGNMRAMMKRSLLKTSADMIEKKIEPLRLGSKSGWSADMSRSAEGLRKVIKEEKFDQAESWFLTYLNQAAQYFFDLDTEMKNRSEELRKIGDQLRIVNKELD